MTRALDPKPPRVARLILRLRPLGPRRAEVTADLDEVFAERTAAEGAGRAARRYYHDVLSLWTWNLSGRRLVGDAVQDLGYGLRVFRRNPGAVAISLLGLALAIAVSTSVFSLLNATLLRGTGVSDPGTTVRVMYAVKDGIANSWTYANYLTLREHARMPIEASFGDAARFTTSPLGRRSPGQGGSDDGGEPVQLMFTGEGYLRGFGARPLHGRVLQPVDDVPGAPPVVVATRSTLIGVQAAASLVLLVLGALLTRATMAATQADIGFDARPLVAIAPALGGDHAEPAKTQAYWNLALERVRGLPNVRAASLTLYPPYGGLLATRQLMRNGTRYEAYLHETHGDYFSTLGLRIVRGRPYTAEEMKARAKVVVISETLARDFWPGQDPVGQSLAPVDGSTDTVIGVVSDAVSARLHARSAAALYRPLQSAEAPSLLLRTDGPPEAVVPALRNTMQALDPGVRFDIKLVATGLQDEVEEPRIMAKLAGALATLALALAIVGIYGVTTFVTGQRTREIGLRIAVGASRGDVIRLLLKDSLRPVAIGLAAGVVIAFVVSRLVAVVFYGVGASDPVSFASAIGVLLVSAAAAVFIPARRAARVDPAFVLRQS